MTLDTMNTQALATSIVQALKEYGEVPADFLAKVIGRRRWEIQDSLDKLCGEKIIQFDARDNVKLKT